MPASPLTRAPAVFVAVAAIAAAALLASCGRGGSMSRPVPVVPDGGSASAASVQNRAEDRAGGDDENPGVRVMTYNVDEGTDFLEVSAAHTQMEFLLGVGQLISNVRATNPPQRMSALARQIGHARPDVVSLQEVSLWSTGPFDRRSGTCGPVTAEFDLLAELLDSLAQQGAHYRLAVEATQLATPPIPGLILPSRFLCAQAVNRIALLVRTVEGGDRSPYELGSVQSGHYANQALFTFPGGSLPSSRAWVYVDVTARGRTLRVVGTHLESSVASIRRLQGAELRNGAAHTTGPVVLAMDSNAPAGPDPLDPTYSDFVADGFRDVWARLHPSEPGFTCCQAPLVDNPASQLSQRIDLVLTRGLIRGAKRIGLVGADPLSRTPSGLWPSDHAGVAAELRIDQEMRVEHGR